ncbi:MAG: hypothetical protein ACYS6K_20895, partial [Planctomycetota bacterium]
IALKKNSEGACGQLTYWRLLLYGFVRNAAITGTIKGATAIAITNNELLNQRIISLYKKGSTNPNEGIIFLNIISGFDTVPSRKTGGAQRYESS